MGVGDLKIEHMLLVEVRKCFVHCAWLLGWPCLLTSGVFSVFNVFRLVFAFS